MNQDTDMVDDSSQPSSSGSSNGANRAQQDDMGGYHRFRVRKWSPVALWAYNLTVDDCAICRNHIMDKCIECQSTQETSNREENCIIVWGKCSHVFHLHCISRWLNTRKVCPLDNSKWELKRYGT